MRLSMGEKLGPYEILAPIGAGGMGEVWKARDSRLDRLVAIKVGAAHFSERFEREARAIAQLNHPHICQLHDVGPDYLVMELVEGVPLAGPMPFPRAIHYAEQILDALDAAHRKGIIHRDLKPANILVTRQGIKLLDFGLAKQLSTPEAADATRTIALTKVNTILGTLHYMSPEQLEAKEADARSDLFAFGAVLYEMLTGKRAFAGTSQASVVAAILERDPPSVGDVAPAAIDRVLCRCLAKDPEARWQSASDVKGVLEWIAQDIATVETQKKSPRWERTGWIALAGSLLMMALWFAARSGRGPDAGSPVRFAIYPPEKSVFSGSVIATVPVPQFALSPDGGALVFAASTAGAKPMLWVRTMDGVAPHPLAGTENAQNPFWSPDGRWVGFFVSGKLEKIPVGGGAVQVVTEGLADNFGGSWGADDTILFTTGINPIFSVSSAGGTVTPVTSLDKSTQEQTHRWPQFLPDGRHFLFLVQRVPAEQSGVYAGSVDGKPPKLLIRSNANAVYARPGYLLWVDGDALLGQAFDAERLRLNGQPFTVAEQVGRSTAFQIAASASRTGTLAYSGAILRLGNLTWFDHNGIPLGSAGPEGDSVDFRISPDDKRVAVSVADRKAGHPDIWLTDLARGNRTQFTFGPGINASVVWSPDGTRLLYRKVWGGLIEFYEKSAAGGGDESAVLKWETYRAAGIPAINLVPSDWSPDGRNLIYSVPTLSGFHLWVMPLAGDRKPVQYLASPSDQLHANFSPGGHLVAYSSNESGRFEVYVQTFPLSDRKWQVSTNGGYEPRWRADGREIYYLSEDRKLMAAAVGTGPSFDAPKPLFQTRIDTVVHANRTHYVPSRDGRRFLINTQVGEPAPVPIIIALNWTVGLKK